jgi:hypothetical protein
LRAEEIVHVSLDRDLVGEKELVGFQLIEVFGVFFVFRFLLGRGKHWLLPKDGFFILLDIVYRLLTFLSFVWNKVSKLFKLYGLSLDIES